MCPSPQNCCTVSTGNGCGNAYGEPNEADYYQQRDPDLEASEGHGAMGDLRGSQDNMHHRYCGHTNSFLFFVTLPLRKKSHVLLLSVVSYQIERVSSKWELPTTLQSMVNAKLSPHRFWPCHENGLIKTIQTIPHNQYVSFKLTSLYCGLRIILVYPNPQ